MVEITDEIIQRAARGDTDAFEDIYRSYAGFVYTLARRVVDHPQDAEEVTQEAFIQIYKQLRSFRFQSSLKTWIYRIAVNTALNFVKKRSRHNKRETVLEHEPVASDTAKQDVADKEQKEHMIASLLNLLNPDQRACVILRNIEGLSYQEIADALKISINTVRTRLKRAREKLLGHKDEVMKDAVG